MINFLKSNLPKNDNIFWNQFQMNILSDSEKEN